MKKLGYLLIGLLVLSTLNISGTDASNGITPWWNYDYGYRQHITINNLATSEMEEGYTVKISLDQASLVSAGKSLASGDDVRVVYWDGASNIELDRISDTWNSVNTEILFKTQASISASGSDSNYYLYYGNPNAGSPPADASNVYMFSSDSDDFNDNTLDTTKWDNVVNLAEQNQRLEKTGTPAYFRTAAPYVYSFATRRMDYRGGVSNDMLALITGPGAGQSNMGNGYGFRKDYQVNYGTALYRYDNGTVVQLASVRYRPSVGTWHRIRVEGGVVYAEISSDGVNYNVLMSASDSTYNPLMTPLHGYQDEVNPSSAWAAWDDTSWRFSRKYISPEPATVLGPEEIPAIPAAVDIDPDTLNTNSNGKWITAYIVLPSGYSVEDIDITTVKLQGTFVARRSDVQGNRLMVKFARNEVAATLSEGSVELTVTGKIDGGPMFQGTDSIRVINKGK